MAAAHSTLLIGIAPRSHDCHELGKAKKACLLVPHSQCGCITAFTCSNCFHLCCLCSSSCCPQHCTTADDENDGHEATQGGQFQYPAGPPLPLLGSLLAQTASAAWPTQFPNVSASVLLVSLLTYGSGFRLLYRSICLSGLGFHMHTFYFLFTLLLVCLLWEFCSGCRNSSTKSTVI